MAKKPEKPKKDKDTPKKEKPKVSPELSGFDVKIDTFGEIRSSMSIDEINKFLNRTVDDKKLRDREDLEFIKEKKKEEDDKKKPNSDQE